MVSERIDLVFLVFVFSFSIRKSRRFRPRLDSLRDVRRYRCGEEEPRVRAAAGARTFDGDWNTVRSTGLGKRGSIFLPRALVEIDRQEPTRLVVEQRIATDDMPASQVINNDLVVYRDEGLICAVRAPPELSRQSRGSHLFKQAGA
jgi:hypothetical protein